MLPIQKQDILPTNCNKASDKKTHYHRLFSIFYSLFTTLQLQVTQHFQLVHV